MPRLSLPAGTTRAEVIATLGPPWPPRRIPEPSFMLGANVANGGLNPVVPPENQVIHGDAQNWVSLSRSPNRGLSPPRSPPHWHRKLDEACAIWYRSKNLNRDQHAPYVAYDILKEGWSLTYLEAVLGVLGLTAVFAFLYWRSQKTLKPFPPARHCRLLRPDLRLLRLRNVFISAINVCNGRAPATIRRWKARSKTTIPSPPASRERILLRQRHTF